MKTTTNNNPTPTQFGNADKSFGHGERSCSSCRTWLPGIAVAAAMVCSVGIITTPGHHAIAFATSDETVAEPEDVKLPELDSIKEAIVEIRGLEFKQEVPAVYQNGEDFAEFVQAELDKEMPEGTYRDMTTGLYRLGMLMEDIDLKVELKDAFLSQAGGYYDPATKRFFYLTKQNDAGGTLETIASHELVHAIQDQHFDLDKTMRAVAEVEEGMPRNDDAILAVRCLVEGEATYVQMIWQTKTMMGMDLLENQGMEDMMFQQMANIDAEMLTKLASNEALGAIGGIDDDEIKEAMKAMESIPPYIMNPLMAAYMKGAYFSMKARHQGGWESLNKAYKDLPVSAEQVLHPTKYFGDRDVPTSMVFDTPAALEDWDQLDAAIHGEFYLQVLLTNFDSSPVDSKNATAGWDGDAYAAYRNADTDDIVVVMATTWDTDAEAQEFYREYRSILAKKFTDLEMDKISEQLGDASVTYHGADKARGFGQLVHRGKEVFFVEGGSKKLNQTILNELQANEIEYKD